ncbi:MAG: aldo/keto reductase [Segetibacter sp.]|jgi:aryl-alcohol dehydrogenase-like predicted oxidoreductase|nr:aldo/keto reductase [Segetibacter sp.]
MNYRQLGTSDLRISPIGFGCMSLKVDQPENERIIHDALEYGINYFDTADLYDKGLNETLLGKAFKGIRDKVILATKVGNQWRADGSGFDWNPHKEYILTSVEESLRRLQTDYIDLYQLHGGTIEDPIDETIEAFELLKKQGKIRYYGISSIRPNVIREYVNRSNIVSVMMQYSLLDRRPEESCLPLLQQHGIGVLARGSVASGLLVNKPAKNYLNYNAEQVQEAAVTIKNISGEKRSAAQTAIQFVLENPAITSAVVGIRTLEQLKDAVETLSVDELTDSEMEELRRSVDGNYYEQHR